MKQIKGIHKILGINVQDPDLRTGADMQSVLHNQKNCKLDPDLICYEMYRDRYATEQDHVWLQERSLRYDVTVIFPHIICGEYNKTKGHYHPVCFHDLTYPELYEVISGQAIYLLQKQDLSDIVAVHAKAGEAVLIPPNYGHVTINPSISETLVMANIVSSQFESIYGDYEERCGAAYHYLSDETFVKNSAYPGSIPPLRTVYACDMKMPSEFPKAPIYAIIKNEVGAAFFQNPSTHQEKLKDLL